MTSVGFRNPPAFQLIVVWCAATVLAENVEIVTPENARPAEEEKNGTALPQDSYVRAYEEVQKLRWGPAKRRDQYELPAKDEDGPYDTVIRSSYLSDHEYPSITHHWAPSAPPHPPHPHHHHHFHHPPCRPVPYSAPSDSHFGLLPKKLGAKLLLKILLKLVLFKMIVKFIAVICLLLFIPALKAKETKPEVEEERRRGREIDEMSELIWNSIEEKNSAFADDGEMKDIREIAEEMDEDEEDNYFSGPLKAVRFLEFCVSTVDRVVGFVLGILDRRNRNEGEDLGSFVLEKLDNFVKNL